MAVKLRLMRMGKMKQPTYRLVAADSRSPRDGRFIEILGTYQPRLEPSGIQIDNDKALKYLRNGAQATDRVRKLLEQSGAWEEYKPGGTKVGEERKANKDRAKAKKAKNEKPPREEAAAGDDAEADA